MVPLSSKQWIAFLDEDEEDFLFWQFGFRQWANTIELKWFPSAEAFLTDAPLIKTKPNAMILDGIVPYGSEKAWLTTFLGHACCQHIPIYLLSAQYNPSEQEEYLELGAAEYLIKPSTAEDLHQTVQKVMGYLADWYKVH